MVAYSDPLRANGEAWELSCRTQRIAAGPAAPVLGPQRESVCCLLVLNSVTLTPHWTRQLNPEPRDVHDVCVFVCKCVLGSPRASQPLKIFAYAFSSTRLPHFASCH